jgi:transposase InsO family protein
MNVSMRTGSKHRPNQNSLIEFWRSKFDESRSHSALNEKIPGEFASDYAATPL